MMTVVDLICDSNVCTERAGWLPVLQMRARPDSKPSEMALSLLVCEKCAQTTDLKELEVLAHNWDRLKAAYSLLNGEEPVRDLTSLIWKRLDDPDPMVQIMLKRALLAREQT